MSIVKRALRDASIAAGLLPALTFAQAGPPLPGGPTEVTAFINIICGIAGWMFVFLVVLAIIFVILAAFNYLTAGGDAEKVKTASNQLIYAAVAVAVGIFARGFPLLVSSLTGIAITGQC